MTWRPWAIGAAACTLSGLLGYVGGLGTVRTVTVERDRQVAHVALAESETARAQLLAKLAEAETRASKVHTRTVVVRQPDGASTETTESTREATSVRTVTKEVEKVVFRDVVKRETVYVDRDRMVTVTREPARPRWYLGGLAGLDGGRPVYGASASVRVLGPVEAGLWGLVGDGLAVGVSAGFRW